MPSSSSSHAPADFGGLWIPLITPFAGARVDHAALATLARRLAREGATGYVVCGSTGEAAAMRETEQLEALATVRDAVPELPCIMGLAGERLGHALDRLEQLNGLGLQGVLASAPHYIRPAQDGIQAWFTQLADASAQPLLIYDIPYRTGVPIAAETLLALAAHPRIAALKDCSGDAAKLRRVIADGRLQVLAGEDLQIFSTVAEGGVGAIAASAHVQTARFARVIAALRSGDLPGARAAWQPLPALIDALFAHPNPAAIKGLLAHRGEVQNTLRLPMTAAPDALLARLLATDAAAQAGISRP